MCSLTIMVIRITIPGKQEESQDLVQSPLEGDKYLGGTCNSTISNTIPVFLFFTPLKGALKCNYLRFTQKAGKFILPVLTSKQLSKYHGQMLR